MIANVVAERGSRVRGLVEYLWGPGKVEEHEHPRVVAGWDATFVRDAGEPSFDEFERRLLAQQFDAPMRLHGISPGEHVYHVSVSVHVNDGELSDEQWRQVAEEAADKLGLTATDEHAAVPWFAMRHGRSASGNDHIHFVAAAYREDGQQVHFRNDFHVWSQVRANAEQRWDLTRTRTQSAQRGVPGVAQGEIQRAARQGRSETERETLHRTVRAAAVQSRDEAEFVGRLRRQVLVRPRWQRGGQTHVEGYSVALRPSEQGQKPVWFGSSKLADDLTLSTLRQQWGSPSEERAADARRAWRPRGWRQMPRGRDVARRRLRSEAWQEASSRAAEVTRAFRSVSPDDAPAWSGVSRDAAGTLAALSGRVDKQQREQLRRAASQLGRAGQVGRGERVQRRAESAPLAGVARVCTDAVLVKQGGPVAMAGLAMQLGRLVQESHTAHVEAGRAVEARYAAEASKELLEFVRTSPSPTTGVERARSGERAGPTPGRDQGAAPRPSMNKGNRDERTEWGR